MTSIGKAPHILEIDLQKYCNINRIVLHTGIPESERTPAEASQAAGFWSAKNFKIQYWDDANWTDLPNTEIHENRLTTVPYSFTSPINTFKVRFVCDDGEPISVMEIEVFGMETSNIPVPGINQTSLLKKTEKTGTQNVSIKINENIVGKTMKYVGYNQGYYEKGCNAAGWIEYSNVNSVRIWTSLDAYSPLSTVEVDKGLTTIEEFDKRKNELRSSPENNKFIKWNELLKLYDGSKGGADSYEMALNFVLPELKSCRN